jgi:hypothetical protein
MTFRAILVLSLIFLSAGKPLAQSAFENTLKLYQSEIGQKAQIYSGSQYKGYSFRIQNNAHAYFLSADWQKGKLWYNGLQYTDLLLKLDLVKQKLILKDDYRMIELASGMIDSFEINGNKFVILMTADKVSSFFEVLAKNGQTLLLKHYHKTIQEDITRAVEGVKRNISVENKYFLFKDDKLIALNKKKDAIAIFGKTFSKKDFKAKPDQHFIELFKTLILQ